LNHNVCPRHYRSNAIKWLATGLIINDKGLTKAIMAFVAISGLFAHGLGVNPYYLFDGCKSACANALNLNATGLIAVNLYCKHQ